MLSSKALHSIRQCCSRNLVLRCTSVTLLPPSQKQSFSTESHEADDSNKKAVLIIGSSGALGGAIAQHLKTVHGCFTVGADLRAPPSQNSQQYLDTVLELSADYSSIPELAYGLETGLEETLEAEEGSRVEFNAIIVASGGFATDPPPPEDPNSPQQYKAANVYEHMMKLNYNPVVAAGMLIPRYMTLDNGLFVAIGATAALAPSPTLLAYTSSKAAAHAYLQSLGLTTGKALKNKYLHRNTSPDATFQRQLTPYLNELTVCGILPSTLDTEANRSSMPDAEFEMWTPPLDIARQIGIWLDTPALRPHSGSLMKVETTESEESRTKFKLVR